MAEQISLDYKKYHQLLQEMGTAGGVLKDDDADLVPTDGMSGMDGVNTLLSLYSKAGELMNLLGRLSKKDEKKFNQIAMNFVNTDKKLSEK